MKRPPLSGFQGLKVRRLDPRGQQPRGTLALDGVAHACLRHRLLLPYEAEAESTTKNTVVDELLRQDAVV
ncbi:hypothetical protein [Verrucomicrobium spinosum]|uniref:hypothetical protein n=1 Tax=Verrucomicrobium spinosum TaxID=2736 RepID=UPI0001746B35|nr:hypothetical protein [Verrucomicrobium spinosum]